MRQPLLFCLLVLMAFCLTACKDDAGTGQQMPPAYVQVFDVTARDVPWPGEYQATAAGSRAVDVRARVQGIIEKRLYREGDYVKAGQQLFQLERDQYEAIVEQSQAAFNNAQREWNRIRPLYAANAVSQKERDQALSNFESTKAALRQAKINLDYCQVVSPVSGYTTKEAQTEGNLVSNGALLTMVNQTDPLYIEFSLAAPERMQREQLAREGRLRLPENGNYNARLRLLDGRMYDQAGKVDFIDSQVEASMGVIRARATFPNADRIVAPGQYVRLFMDGDVLVNAVLIPQQCVQITSRGTFVMALNEKNVPSQLEVKLGPFVGKDYLVLEGLKGGERIISDGLLKARPGVPVRYDDPNAPKKEKNGGQVK